MRKHLIFLLLAIFIIPSIAFASWWNPISWFKKRTVPSPVVQASVPISNQTLPKNAGCHSNKGFNLITGAPCGSSTASTTTTKPKKEKQNIKPTIKQNTTIISAPTTVTPAVNASRSALIAEFLKNPTLDNLKTFCAQAKNVTSNSTKQVLDSSRENLITVKQTLYEEMIDCQRLDSNTYNIHILPLDDSSLVPLKNSDTDKIREAKIATNNKIKSLITTSKVKIFGFQYLHGSYSPVQLFKCIEGTDTTCSPRVTNTDGQVNYITEYIGGYINDLSNDFK